MKKLIFAVVIISVLWSCTTLSQHYKSGYEAAMNKDWDRAVELYEKALLEDPQNSVYRLALYRARVAASYSHLYIARGLVAEGKKEEALREYELAFSYDTTNLQIYEEAKRYALKGDEEEKPKDIIVEKHMSLDVSKEKIQLKFMQEASLRSIFQALGKHAGVNILFDETFSDKPFSIDLSDMDFEQAVQALCLASKNFYRIIDPKTLIVVPDQPMNRAKYEVNVIKTFYLSNINAQEILGSLTTMTRTQFKAPSIIVDKNLNSVTVRDTPEVVALAERLIRKWDKPKGEVVVDVEFMEVKRVRLKELGLDFDTHGASFRYAPESADSSWLNLANIDFTKAENFQITLPTAFVKFLATDSDTKILAQPRLRGLVGEPIEYMVGDQVPIPITTFTPIAAGGVNQQPITSFEYKDVGIIVKITPYIHAADEVTLEMEFELKAISGSGYGDIPIIATRKVKNIIRLKDGETNLMAGLLQDQERQSIKGIVGLRDVPILGGIFSKTDLEIQQTDLIMTITPNIIRSIPMDEEDEKPVWVNLGGTSVGGSGMQAREEDLFDERMRRERLLMDRERNQQPGGQNQLTLNPANFEGPQNRDFRVNVNISSSVEVGNMSFNLSFNPQVLELKQVIVGGYAQQFGKNPSFLQNIDNSGGMCTIGFSSPDVSKGFRGRGRVATLVFSSKGKGESPITFSGISANSPTGQSVSFTTRESRITIR
ncbi:MAG: cohesin domain-containing protein [Candidatus Aminicenantes bacterium]|jgi:general secretion pathway protein D